MCDCKSYNLDADGSSSQKLLDPNPHFGWDAPADPVPVDACIASEIRALWEAGVWTRGCCCGHGDRAPNVVLDRTEDPEDAKEVLKETDDRNWKVLQWQLVEC